MPLLSPPSRSFRTQLRYADFSSSLLQQQQLASMQGEHGVMPLLQVQGAACLALAGAATAAAAPAPVLLSAPTALPWRARLCSLAWPLTLPACLPAWRRTP